MKTAIVYSVSSYGHRLLYSNCLSSELDGEPIVARPSIEVLFNLLLEGRPIIFVTIEDSFLFFFLCSVGRSFLGKITVGLSLEVKACTKTSGLKYDVKHTALKFIDRSLYSKRFSIVPSSINTCISTKNCDWIYDPAFWDLSVNTPIQLFDPLRMANRLLRAELDAAHIVILYLGSIDPQKGFDRFVRLVDISQRSSFGLRFIAAGHCGLNANSQDIHKFLSLGGILLNRRLTEEEVLVLQNVSDIFWGCYHPSFDQSSGIAGRAFQLDKTVIVRKNSISEKLMIELDGNHISSDFDNVNDLPSKIEHVMVNKARLDPQNAKASLRDFSTIKLRRALLR